jgi:glycosyltransferase involved in cell wall biosynthesis
MPARNILFLDHTAKLGGGELSLLDLLEGLDRSLYHPIVMLASDGPLTQKVRDLDIDVRVVPLSTDVIDTKKDTLRFAAFLKVTAVFEILKYAFTIAQLARKLKVELIHTNSLKSDIYGGLAGRIAAIPTVWHVRDRIDGNYLPKAATTLFRALCKVLPHAVIANSQSTLSCLQIDRKPISAVVYGCFSSAFDTNESVASNSTTKDISAPVVAVVGRIAEWKGQHIFIEAAASIKRQHPTARFWIIGAPLFGEEEYERSLHKQVDSLGENVSFLGFRSDVANLLRNASVVVHSSCVGEPFGRVVIEGMAAAKPVVATNGGAIPEIITDGITGRLVPMNDSDSMAEAICDLLSDPAGAAVIGKNARQKVLDCFTPSQTVHGVQQVYSRLLPSM